ncbi:MAG TPA: hypothetical protein ENG61_01555 [Candidatus Korarchaeota archaeon]|nr:hypothetical protein [Candidatus Korarchaeota archaeon]
MFALRADVTVPEVRGRVDALTRLMANLMLSASNVAGGKLYETSPRSTIVVSALLMGSMAIISLTLLPKKPKDRRGKQDE